MTLAATQHPHSATSEPTPTGQLRIADAARQIGVSPSALRQWERQGLVRPMRTPAGYRLYSTDDLDRLRRVRRLRRVERVNAPGIRRILDGGSAPAAPMADGSRLRALRLEHGFSLREASRRSGLSISFISAVERESTGASVATLQRLTSAYGSTLLELLASSAPLGRVVRRDERAVLQLGSADIRIEQLANGHIELEPQLFVLRPGASSEGAYAHAGEEFLFVLEGNITVWIADDECYRLGSGDALSFPSSLPHRWRNEASKETRLLWINTPPTF